MSGQGELFDPKRLARREDPATSKAAAEGAETLSAQHEGAIVDYLAGLVEGGDRRGRRKDEIAAAIGLSDVAVARRMKRLVERGYVEAAGGSPGPSGRAATLWRATR